MRLNWQIDVCYIDMLMEEPRVCHPFHLHRRPQNQMSVDEIRTTAVAEATRD